MLLERCVALLEKVHSVLSVALKSCSEAKQKFLRAHVPMGVLTDQRLDVVAIRRIDRRTSRRITKLILHCVFEIMNENESFEEILNF